MKIGTLGSEFKPNTNRNLNRLISFICDYQLAPRAPLVVRRKKGCELLFQKNVTRGAGHVIFEWPLK